MKHILRAGIRGIVTALARGAIALHKPTVIAITGSVGKTTVKDMVAAILRESGRSVRESRKSYNSEFGVPLSILGLPSGGNNPFIWLYVLAMAPIRAVARFPDCIVLEIGLEKPKDITSVTRWLKPDVAVLTQLPRHPVHGENFAKKEDLYDEKIALLRAVKPGGVAAHNKADAIQSERARTVPDTVRLKPYDTDAELIATGIHYNEKDNPIGTDVTLLVEKKEEPFYIPETLGIGSARSLVTAIATVRATGAPVETSAIRKAVASRPPTPGRMRILPGKNGSVVIDDSYNASPIAMENALRTLAAIRKRRKVAVLGVMAQLGPDGKSMHEALGKKASEAADHVIIVGDAPYGSGEAISRARDTREAAEQCLKIAGPETVFLCKGSQTARIEKVVENLLAPGIRPEEVLVRQEPCWKTR